MAEVDVSYERNLRNQHQADRVANGVVGHGPCDVCFLFARIDRLNDLLHRIAVARRGDSPDVDSALDALPGEIEGMWAQINDQPTYWESKG